MIDTMTTNEGAVADVIAEARQHWSARRLTVRQLTRLIGVRQTEIADALGMSRQTFNGRMTGATNLEPWELAGIAAMLGVPVHVLEMEPNDAIRWILDHPEVSKRMTWSPLSSQRAA
jgi:DNA-binding XRE family transcriptional regulator